MSIYPGTEIEQEFYHGRDAGYTDGENDLATGLGLTHDVIAAARIDVSAAWDRKGRAYALGYLRGYREAVRSFKWGRWGT
jgi:hypothetical protein